MELKSGDIRWYAVYTAPRAEKAVGERFTKAGIAHYLGLQKVRHHWSDRVKEIMEPVIKGYIFVHIPTSDFSRVTGIYGAISFVKEAGAPIPIPDDQMKAFRFMVSNAGEPVEYTTDPYEPGEIVRINKGNLEGMIGEWIENKGKHKVMIRLSKFGCAMVTVPVSFVERNMERNRATAKEIF